MCGLRKFGVRTKLVGTKVSLGGPKCLDTRGRSLFTRGNILSEMKVS